MTRHIAQTKGVRRQISFSQKGGRRETCVVSQKFRKDWGGVTHRAVAVRKREGNKKGPFYAVEGGKKLGFRMKRSNNRFSSPLLTRSKNERRRSGTLVP